jgi:hypothetical protein
VFLSHISILHTLLRKPSHTHVLLELSLLLICSLGGKFMWCLKHNSKLYLGCFMNANWTKILVLYTCVLWKLFGKYFSALFSFFQIFFCVCSVWMMCRSIWTVILYVRMVILVVQTIQLFRLDAHGSYPDGCVFVISDVAPRLDITYVPSGRCTL